MPLVVMATVCQARQSIAACGLQGWWRWTAWTCDSCLGGTTSAPASVLPLCGRSPGAGELGVLSAEHT